MDDAKRSIKNWSEQDQPREKMMALGAGGLTDSELIAILISTGTKDQSAIDVARNLLARANFNLSNLAALTLTELKQTKGIGEAKAISIVAALELGRRRSTGPKEIKQKINSSATAAALFDHLKTSKQEEMWLACLNRALIPKFVTRVHLGGITSVVSDQRIILSIALEYRATSILIAHNHPSGIPQPSQSDFDMTEKLKAAGALLEIRLADHLIITEQGYYSFADAGML